MHRAAGRRTPACTEQGSQSVDDRLQSSRLGPLVAKAAPRFPPSEPPWPIVDQKSRMSLERFFLQPQWASNDPMAEELASAGLLEHSNHPEVAGSSWQFRARTGNIESSPRRPGQLDWAREM